MKGKTGRKKKLRHANQVTKVHGQISIPNENPETKVSSSFPNSYETIPCHYLWPSKVKKLGSAKITEETSHNGSPQNLGGKGKRTAVI